MIRSANALNGKFVGIWKISEEEEKSQTTVFISCDHWRLRRWLIANRTHRSLKPELDVGQRTHIIIGPFVSVVTKRHCIARAAGTRTSWLHCRGGFSLACIQHNVWNPVGTVEWNPRLFSTKAVCCKQQTGRDFWNRQVFFSQYR